MRQPVHLPADRNANHLIAKRGTHASKPKARIGANAKYRTGGRCQRSAHNFKLSKRAEQDRPTSMRGQNDRTRLRYALAMFAADQVLVSSPGRFSSSGNLSPVTAKPMRKPPSR